MQCLFFVVGAFYFVFVLFFCMRLPVTHVAEWNGLKVCRGAGRKKEEVVRQWSVGWAEGSRKGDGGRVGKEMVTDHKAGWLHYRARTSVASSQRTTVQPLWPVQKGKKTERAVVSFWVKVSEQTSQLQQWAPANSADCLTKQSAKEQEWPWRPKFNTLPLSHCGLTLHLNHCEHPEWRS